MSDGSSPFKDIVPDDAAATQPQGLAGDPFAADPLVADPLAADPMAGAIPMESAPLEEAAAAPLATEESVPSDPSFDKGKRPGFNVFTAMLGLSLVALCIACLLLFFELGNYGGGIGTWWKTDR